MTRIMMLSCLHSCIPKYHHVLPYKTSRPVLLSPPVQGPGDEPVWRQLVRLYLDDIYYSDVVQQAAAALAQ
jgi:hypothetical protein